MEITGNWINKYNKILFKKKGNISLIHSITWMKLESILLIKRDHTQKKKNKKTKQKKKNRWLGEPGQRGGDSFTWM